MILHKCDAPFPRILFCFVFCTCSGHGWEICFSLSQSGEKGASRGGWNCLSGPGPPLHTKAASFTTWGQPEPLLSGKGGRAKAAQAQGCDGGGHGDRRVRKGVLLLTRHPLLQRGRGAGVPLAVSPWVTFLGCGPAPEHPSARPRPGHHPRDARLHPHQARLCVSVTARSRRRGEWAFSTLAV